MKPGSNGFEADARAPTRQAKGQPQLSSQPAIGQAGDHGRERVDAVRAGDASLREFSYDFKPRRRVGIIAERLQANPALLD